MDRHQLSLLAELSESAPDIGRGAYRDRLLNLLRQDLDFHGQQSNYASTISTPFRPSFRRSCPACASRPLLLPATSFWIP